MRVLCFFSERYIISLDRPEQEAYFCIARYTIRPIHFLTESEPVGGKGGMNRQEAVTPQASPESISRARYWTGWVLSGLASLFLAADAIAKIVLIQPVIDASDEIGLPVHLNGAIGVTLAVCVLFYVIPRTAVLGAVLLTGYLGGAVAMHVRLGGPPFSIVFPVLIGALVWGGLALRDRRLLPLLFWRD